MTTQEILSECGNLRRLLEHKAQEIKAQELLKDIDARRKDWERRSALFVPSRQRLERGGKALELGESYEAIKDLRVLRDKNRIRQAGLRDDLTQARTELQNADEALTLAETEYRDKLAEQTKLATTAQRVRALDEQIAERKEAAENARQESDEAEKLYKECSSRVETEQKALERIEVALREARKFLQTHSTDEKLAGTLPGIQKCFAMYEQAEEKRITLRETRAQAIQKRQNAQSILNDRAALFSDVTHRFAVIEKNYARARAFYESTLKGKSISEWREICDKSTKRLEELDELYKKYQQVRELEDKLRTLQDSRLKIQQETRSLNIRDVEQSGKIHELQEEVAKLEKRVALLSRIEDLDAVRKLLQDGIACPLCGSTTHPYASSSLVPNPEEVHAQLRTSRKELDDLRAELTARQTRAGKLNEDIASIGRDETELRRSINELNAAITSKVSLLGLRMSTGISPFEELDRERQKARDTLQLARNAADTSEAAQLDMKAALDELEKITQTREEVSRYNQDALFALQNEKTEEGQIDSEAKTQEEIVESLKRELISQIMPYGYKALPDKNPREIIETLTKRLADWHNGQKKSDELERELSVANTKMAMLKKEKESLRVRREEAISRVKASEAERDSVQQQRIILFASRNPSEEEDRMKQDVEALRTLLNERRELRAQKASRLDELLGANHALETEMARGREELQKHEIAFGKKLLALGFKNEDDYATALLTPDERRDLQNKLRELTQTDLELQAERENIRAKLLELQADGNSATDDELTELAKGLKASLNAMQAKPVNSPIEAEYRDRIISDILPAIKDLMLTCALPEVL